MSRPANHMEMLHRPHKYIKRADGSSGYEPIPEDVIVIVEAEAEKPAPAKPPVAVKAPVK